MLFFDALFLCLFFPTLFAFYLTLTRPTAKKWTLLIASAFFYAWGEPIFVPILLVSCLIDYWLTARLHQATDPAVRCDSNLGM